MKNDVIDSVCGSLIYKPEYNEFLKINAAKDPVVYDGHLNQTDLSCFTKSNETSSHDDVDAQWRELSYQIIDSNVYFTHKMMVCEVS